MDGSLVERPGLSVLRGTGELTPPLRHIVGRHEAQLGGEQQAETDGDHPGAALIITVARKMTTMLQCDFSPTVLYYLYFIILKWCSVIVYFYN